MNKRLTSRQRGRFSPRDRAPDPTQPRRPKSTFSPRPRSLASSPDRFAQLLHDGRSLVDWGVQNLQNVIATPSRRRLFWVWAILMGAVSLLALHLFNLQILQANTLRGFAREQQQPPPPSFVPRRSIVDRLGNPLAVDRPAYSLYVHPKLFEEPPAVIAQQIAPFVERSPADLVSAFTQSDSGIRIADLLSENLANRLRDLGLDGVELVRYPARLYPQNEIAAPVVGYVNFDGLGQAGIEYTHQDLLRRQIAPLGEKDGKTTQIDRATPPVLRFDNWQLQLTLDLRLQRLVRTALLDGIRQFQAQRGTAMVMDARDGSLLALVSEPSYNPNQYYQTPVERFRNWALSDLYEPGSTFKPINVAIALEADAIRPTDTFYDPGQIFIDGWEIANYNYEFSGAGGQLSVTEIVRDSSNVGMVRIMQQMEAQKYYEWLERLQLGEPTQIDLPFEAAGQLKSRTQFLGSPVEPATTAFGQGFAITPIQLVRLYGSLANDGYLTTPHVVRGLVDRQGRVQRSPDRPDPKRVFSSETVASVLAMMEEVVQNGTGQNAQIPGYRIGGKTGTAQKSRGDGGGYSASAVVTSFVAILPIDKPRYVVFVAVDEPVSGTGGQVAAPVAKSIIKQLVAIENIPPSQPQP